VKLLDSLEAHIAKPNSIPRGSFLGWPIRAATSVAAVAAGLTSFRDAYATQCTGLPLSGCNVVCCCLSYPKSNCSSNYYNGQCPCGNSKSCNPWEWMCSTSGSSRCNWVCGECVNPTAGCQPSSNGYSSDPCWCSYAYALCSAGCPCHRQAPTLSAKLDRMRKARVVSYTKLG